MWVSPGRGRGKGPERFNCRSDFFCLGTEDVLESTLPGSVSSSRGRPISQVGRGSHDIGLYTLMRYGTESGRWKALWRFPHHGVTLCVSPLLIAVFSSPLGVQVSSVFS